MSRALIKNYLSKAGGTVQGNVSFENDVTFEAAAIMEGNVSLEDDATFEAVASLVLDGEHGESQILHKSTEEITIPVGQGAAGVDGAVMVCPADSVIIAVVGRVTQAPGGGATQFDCQRDGAGSAEFADAMPVALGTKFCSTGDGDGTHDAPPYNNSVHALKIKTDFNVTGSDMKVRVTVFYMQWIEPTS